MDTIPTETELQKIYNLSKIESEMYVMKLNGSKYADIAEYHNVSLQSVKQTMHNAMEKMRKMDTMNIIVVIDSRDTLTRRATAEMMLRILKLDNEESEFLVGTHTMLLANVPNEVGCTEFITKEVLPYCGILAENSYDAKRKADRFYGIYLEKGGEKGRMGVGILKHIFAQFRIKHDIY